MNALAQLLSVVSATNERALLDALRHISDTSAGNNKAPHLRLIEALNPALDSSHPSGPPA